MEHKCEIRLPGSTFSTHEKWTENVECFFSLLLSSPITFLKDGAKTDRWAIRKKIYNFLSEYFKRKFGRIELEWGRWRHTFNQNIFSFVFLRLVARVKIWLTNEMQYYAHSRSSIKSPWSLLQNVLYIKLSQESSYWNLKQFCVYKIFKCAQGLKEAWGSVLVFLLYLWKFAFFTKQEF